MLEWALIPQDWYPFRKKLGHRDTQRDNHVGHREETPFTGQGERPWEESALLPNLILDLQPLGLASCFMTDTPTSAQTPGADGVRHFPNPHTPAQLTP